MSEDKSLKLRVLFGMADHLSGPLQNITAGNREMAKALRNSRDQLKALGSAQKDVATFREMRASLAGTSKDLERTQARVKSLAAALHSAGPPTEAMVQKFERAKQKAAQLKAAHTSQSAALQGLRAKLSGAGIDTRRLSEHERELRKNITATNTAITTQQAKLAELAARERRVAEARAKMAASQRVASRMASTGTTMAIGGAATTAALAVPVSAFAKAEDSATQLQVALMRAGGIVPPEFQKIDELARRMGDRLPGTTADFQDMMTMLVRQGISANAIIGGMGEATAYLSVQLKKAPNEAAEFAAKLQDATRTTEGDMLGLMDVIQRAFYLGVDDNNMLQGFSKLSPALDTIKRKGLEGAKALAPLLVMADQAGMKGEAAGNAFRKVFQMSMDKKKVGKANKMLGGGLELDFTDGKGEFGGFDKMFAQLEKLKGLSTQDRLSVMKEIFGDDAETLQVVALLMDKGAAGYAEVQARMAAQASLQERVNRQLGTLKNLWDAATGTFTNAMVAFGESISPELKATTEWIGNMSQGLGAWARENPRLAGGLMKAGAAVALLLTVGGALTLTLASILGPMAIVRASMTVLGIKGSILARVLGLAGGALRLVGQGVLFLGRALLMNPIGLAITAIAGGAYLIYRYWAPIKGFFGGLWTGIKAAFSGGLGGIAATILTWSPLGLFYRAFASLLSWFGITLPAQFTGFGANILAGLVAGITQGVGAVKAAITNVASSTVTAFKEKLGIQSPSRVFGALGGFVSQGAAVGISSEKRAVSKAAIGLAAAALTSFASPAMAQAGEMGAGISQATAAGIAADQANVAKAAQDLANLVKQASAVTPAPGMRGFDQANPSAPPLTSAAGIAADQVNTTRAAQDLANLVKQASTVHLAPGMRGFDQASPIAPPLATPQLIAAPAITQAAPIVREHVPIDARPPLRSAPPASTPAPMPAPAPIQISIHAAPGMDPQAIAQAVAAELDRRERAQRSRNVSRLSD